MRLDPNETRLKHLRLFATLAVSTLVPAAPAMPGQPAAATRYVMANLNSSPNAVTFFAIGGTPTAPVLGSPIATVDTGGSGGKIPVTAGSQSSLSVTKVGNEPCVYASNVGSNDITGIAIETQTFKSKTGTPGGDTGLAGIVSNGTYVYAAFPSAKKIATFQTTPHCGLTFLQDVTTQEGGGAFDFALHGNMLVVAYGNGYIESFDISAGVPVSNSDAELSYGHAQGFSPVSVDISKDGRYAIFGDLGSSSGTTAVEVSDISSGALTPTRFFNSLGAGKGSTSVILSPSGGILYVCRCEFIPGHSRGV